MGLSFQAFNTYRARPLRKLHLTNMAQLIRYAIQSEADRPVQPVPRPVIGPAVEIAMMPALVPIAYRSDSYEREEWSG